MITDARWRSVPRHLAAMLRRKGANCEVLLFLWKLLLPVGDEIESFNALLGLITGLRASLDGIETD